MNAIKRKTQASLFVGGALLLGLTGISQAATISPSTYSATIGVGETITVDKTVTIDEGDLASKVDFYFLADNTGSMGGVINSVRTVGTSLLSALSASFSDSAFGVGRYFGDPGEYGSNGNDLAYDVLQTVTTSSAAATSAMSSWVASGGGDGPEANFYALHQAATEGGPTDGVGATDNGLGGGEATGWRAGAQKVVLWFGDVSSHPTSAADSRNTVDQSEAIAALVDAGVTVIGLNSRGAGSGIDTFGQASAVTSATGGALVNSFAGVPISNIVSTISAAVTAGLSSVDINLISDPGSIPGLDVSYACADVLGCTDVGAGESRSLTMTVTGTAAGTYSYNTVLAGFPEVIEEDTIIVGGDTTVPEPSLIVLMGIGMLTFGAARVSRKR